MLTLTRAEVNDPGMNLHQRGLRCEKYWMDENEVDFAGWLWFVFKKTGMDTSELFEDCRKLCAERLI